MGIHSKQTVPTRLTVPENAFPLCRLVFAEMKRLRRTYDDMDYYSGVLRGTFKQWRTNVKLPRFLSVEAALGTLGWEFAALPCAGTLPADLHRDLAALIDKHAAAFPALGMLAELPIHAH